MPPPRQALPTLPPTYCLTLRLLRQHVPRRLPSSHCDLIPYAYELDVNKHPGLDDDNFLFDPTYGERCVGHYNLSFQSMPSSPPIRADSPASTPSYSPFARSAAPLIPHFPPLYCAHAWARCHLPNPTTRVIRPLLISTFEHVPCACIAPVNARAAMRTSRVWRSFSSPRTGACSMWIERMAEDRVWSAAGVLVSDPKGWDIKINSYTLSGEGAEVSLNYGQPRGLLGENGPGKSTFLQSIAERSQVRRR
ncbi:uncharacterized protein C8Q71DRAFT_854781 [Rhodofomes roseus]|uniref:ABC transporter domain-containing protein n=1 Tax=Rhodofomes roseus TaxID=34475 RepID=A0ABQ8KQN2_9APHY|nr:uncharacterized protein C8Q71DRAFT_854781 [Rhodofomes roseus]KAH9840934.1 hypothetical protein C8Q71DRAFT_854781 [Rhodofomes roseus]